MDQAVDPQIYPIGRPTMPEQRADADLKGAFDALLRLPAELRQTLTGCADLDRPIRPGAWSPSILVHHLADTHLASFIRTKEALCAENPTVFAFNIETWAELPDSSGDIEASLRMLEGIHGRWVELLQRLSDEQLERLWQHPSRPGARPIWHLPLLYAWHGEHHRMQIERSL
jgi:hypothetical protein